MMNRRELLYRKTRSPSFLWSLSIGIVSAGLAIGALVHSLMPVSEDTSLIEHLAEEGHQREAFLAYVDHLRKPPLDFYEALDLLPPLAKARPHAEIDFGRKSLGRGELSAALEELGLGEAERKVAAAMFGALSPKVTGGVDELKAMAEGGTRYAAYALGTVFDDKKDYPEAAAWFEKEAMRFRHKGSRWSALALYLQASDLKKVRELKGLAEYRELFTLHVNFEVAILENDWLTVAALVLPQTFSRAPSPMLALAILCGLVWLSFSLQCGHYLAPASWRKGWVCLLALVMGIASIPGTLLMIAFQEGYLHMTERTDLAGGLAYFVLGVGFREELLKLLCFLPLMLVFRRRNALEMLVIASCVGLGFALEENLYYYHRYGILVAPARFLTANFFHMAATGVAGLALFAWYTKRRPFHEFLNVFGVMVLLHGAYDALLSLPALEDYHYFGTAAYVYICFLYFQELRRLRKPTSEPVSLTATFTVGVSFIMAGTIVYLCAHVPVSSALQIIAETALELGAIIYLFLREMPESLMGLS